MIKVEERINNLESLAEQTQIRDCKKITMANC